MQKFSQYESNGKQEFSEKTIALEDMIVKAQKYCPSVVDVLRSELEKEEMVIRKKNIYRTRKKIIGK